MFCLSYVLLIPFLTYVVLSVFDNFCWSICLLLIVSLYSCELFCSYLKMFFFFFCVLRNLFVFSSFWAYLLGGWAFELIIFVVFVKLSGKFSFLFILCLWVICWCFCFIFRFSPWGSVGQYIYSSVPLHFYHLFWDVLFFNCDLCIFCSDWITHVWVFLE